jgi:PAS domain-containing protein
MPVPLTDPAVIARCALISSSFRRLLGRDLLPGLPADPAALAAAIDAAPVVILSHDGGERPRFTFANATARRLWELEWERFIGMPSEQSAEADQRAAREALLARAKRDGFIDDYRGIRVTASGRRFAIEDVILWNLIDDAGVSHGQAATFARWTFL